MAERLAELMASLGYQRYAVSGGDIGGGTVEALAAACTRTGWPACTSPTWRCGG